MFLLVDTCFWSHVKELSDDNIIDLRPKMRIFKWGMTEPVRTELNKHKLNFFVPMDDAFIIPLPSTEKEAFIKDHIEIKGFDKPDQTLIVAGNRDRSTILTDDGDLFMECQSLKIGVMRLPVFCLLLYQENILQKAQISKLFQYWEQNGRYSKRNLNNWTAKFKSM
jgi:hypothetical protein